MSAQRTGVVAFFLILVGLFLFLGWAGVGVSAAGVGPAATPSAYAYLPIILQAPTPTPTATPMPTATPVPSGGSVVGELTREDPNKPTYATHIEDIWFYDLIHNTSGSNATFGVLGVNIDGPAPDFKTLWSGEGAPGGVLSLNAGCWGPNGIPCAPDADAGRQRASLRVTAPGQYTLTLYICYSSFSACRQPGGNWQPLASVQIVAIDWTPQPPGTANTQVSPAAVCHLVTADPARIYLLCRPPGK